MLVIRDLARYRHEGPPPVVTIGNFDGVHLGHQRLLTRLLELAEEHSLCAFVVTFEPHPAHVLAPSRALPLISSYEERLRILERFGIHGVLVIPFDREFAAKDSITFVRRILLEGLGARHVLVGPDTRFGQDRGGDADSLSSLGRQMGFEVTAIAPITVNGHPVSSSAVRKLVLAGDVATAAHLLGRFHRLQGEIVRGRRRGRGMGYPTANLAPSTQLLPADGVYAGRLWRGTASHDAVINVGRRPTFGARERTIEAHLPGFSGDLYGEKAGLDLVARLRDERRFRSQAALAEQIALDLEHAREILR